MKDPTDRSIRDRRRRELVLAGAGAFFALGMTRTIGVLASAHDMTAGEVRKIDKEQKKITLRHGERRDLEMPPMSMVFNVRDPARLDRVAVGDKVRFRAERVDGVFYVTAIEK